MRQAKIPFGGYRFPSRSQFPATGKQGYEYLAADEGKIYLWWNGRYELYGGGGGGTGGDHNGLDGLQGGSVEERYHVSKKASEAAEDIAQKRPQKPVNLSPEADEIDVLEDPTFITSTYYNAWSLPMYGLQLWIYDEDDALVFDSGIVPANQPEYRIATGILQPGARSYTWQMAHVGSNLIASERSDKTAFVTAEVWPEQYIDRPKLLLPTPHQIYNSAKPTLLLSAPSTHGGVTPGTRNFKITADPQGEMLLESGTSATDFFQAQNNVQRGQLLYAFGQHTSEDPVPELKSKWSFGVPFSSKELFRDVRIGLCLTDEANWIFQRIDRDYMPVDTDGDYWMTNPIWQMWVESLNVSGGVPQYIDVDGQKMIRLPLIWIKSGRVSKGPFAGKRFWMIDPTTSSEEEQADGWHKHAAFAHPDGGYQDNILLSAYALRISGGVATSVSSGTADTVTKAAGWASAVAKRNTDMENPLKRGWKPMPYYFFELFKLLGMIEYGSVGAFAGAHCGASLLDSFGYRGIKLWNFGASGYSVPFILHGLTAGSAALPGMAGNVNLPFTLIPLEGVPSDGYGSQTLPVGICSSEDGISDILHFDDYMILKPSNPYTAGTAGGNTIYTNRYGSQVLTARCQLCTGQRSYHGPTTPLGHSNGGGANNNAPNDTPGLGMMVKYD